MTLTPPQIEVLRKLPADGSDYILTPFDLDNYGPWQQLSLAGLIEGRWIARNITPSGIEALKEIDNG